MTNLAGELKLNYMRMKLYNAGIIVVGGGLDQINDIIDLEIDGSEMTGEQLEILKSAINEEKEYFVDVTIKMQNKPNCK